jgi:flagellar protein FliS
MIKSGISAYRSGLKTVSPLASIVLLYDGVLARIGRAAAAAERGDTRDQLDHVLRAVQILNGLNQSLDMEAGGRVAVSLRDMYGAIAIALYTSVGSSTAVEASEKIAAGLRQTRDAWAHIAGLDGASSPKPGSTRSPSSAIVNREQELLRHRTSKKSVVHDRSVSEHPEPEPGSLPGHHRPVRGKLGSLA